MERELPLMVRRYGIRNNSGGRGFYSGGNGIVREIQFNEAAILTLLADRRKKPPWGLNGGESGKRGADTLIRKNGALVETSWDEALDYTASKLKEIKEAHGSDSIGFLASAKVTNEENYLIMKFARAAVGTNNVDHCARL